MSRNRTRTTAGVVAAAFAAFLALAVAAPASAHSQVVSTDPEDGATITTLPAEISVTANEDLADLTGTGQGFALYLVGPDGQKYGGTPISIDGPTVSTAVPADLPAGEYTMSYQIVSADTHPVAGSLHFTYAPDGTAEPGSTAPSEQPVGADQQPGAGAPAATGDATAAGESGPAAGPLAWIVPLAIVVVVGAILVIVLAVRRRPRG